jgi:predicted TIM-barrel fold metal-dependent hydrolase
MFRPSTTVFDCNAALGRRHDRRVAYDTRADLRRVMAEAGIAKSLVYNPYCVHFGTTEGNRFLLEEIAGDPDLIPQFVVNFATDEMAEVESLVREAGVRALRVFPVSQHFPLVHWIADPWLEWMASLGLSLWISMGRQPEVDARDLYDTARRHPRVPIVLAGSHYAYYPVVWPLVRALDNIHVDLSRFDIPHGVQRLIGRIGVERLLYGSDFPEVDPEPYLHYLHRSELDPAQLAAICHGNLSRLLQIEVPR